MLRAREPLSVLRWGKARRGRGEGELRGELASYTTPRSREVVFRVAGRNRFVPKGPAKTETVSGRQRIKESALS
jgi:hypothetical protein